MTRNQRMTTLQPIFDNEKKMGGINIGNTAPGTIPLPLPTSGDAGALAVGVYSSAANINVVAGDVLFVITVRRGLSGVTPGAPSISGTCTHGTITQIGTTVHFDTLGVSNGDAAIWAALVTGGGTLNVGSTMPDERSSWVVVSGLETVGATSLGAAFGTVKSTKATEGVTTYSVAPDASTGGGDGLLTLWGGGGDDPGSGYGLGAFTYSAGPPYELTTANIFAAVSAYSGWTSVFAAAPYNTVSQTFTTTHPSVMTSGGMAIFQIELNAD